MTQAVERDFSSQQRKDAAKSGAAMSDGSFPIKNVSELKNAIQALGRASDPAAAKRHIIKRARALNAIGSLPDDWNVTESDDYDIAWLPQLSEAQMAEALGLGDVTELVEKGNAETLRRYWTEGEGAAKIRWGVGGDFMRCVRHLEKYVSDPKGYCEKMHERATGATPGHAAGEAAVAEADRVYHWKHGWIPLDHESAPHASVSAAHAQAKIDHAQENIKLAKKLGYKPGTSVMVGHQEMLKRAKKELKAHQAGAPKEPDLSPHIAKLEARKAELMKLPSANASRSAVSDQIRDLNRQIAQLKSKESEDVTALPNEIIEVAQLVERAVAGKPGRWNVDIISAGKGSSGIYRPDVLEDAARKQLVRQGTPLFFDHPSESQRTDRPERSVRDIAAVFTSPARYDASSAKLVGEIQVFGPYRELVNEMAPYIGLSIHGSATDITPSDEGPVVEGLAAIDSVDLVTRAGRGGKFNTLLESAREQMNHLMYDTTAEEGQMTTEQQPDPAPDPQPDPTPDPAPDPTPDPQPDPAPSPTQEAHMTDTPPRNPREVMERQLAEQGRQISLLRAENRSRDIVAEVLTTGWIGEAQRARLASTLVRDIPLTGDGELDEAALRQRAQTALDEAETEAAEILDAAGVGSPRGLGALTTPATEAAGKQFKDDLRESFIERGLSEAAADLAVKGR